jgi:hypothetical protein
MSLDEWLVVWSAVAAIAAALTLGTVILAGFFTVRQIREAAESRRLQAALAFIAAISTPDLRNARRLIYSEHSSLAECFSHNPTWAELDESLKQISSDRVDLDCLQSYLASLENVSMLVLYDLMPRDLAVMYFGRMAPYHWTLLRPVVGHFRENYGTDDYLQHFELFVEYLQRGNESRVCYR